MTDPAPTRVIFVDDEERILAGLRRQFRSHRTGWSMRFFDSPHAALADLEREPADVVVSDMRMPGMSGAAFLREVQQRWPASIRFILSGQTDQAALLDDIGAIHQFLQKPCEPGRLEDAVNRTMRLAAIVDSPELRTIAASVSSLPVSSACHRTLLEVLRDERADARAISRVVEQDVGLSTKLMQLVNSAFFGLPRRVTSVQDAVVLIGAENLRELAITANVLDAVTAGAAETDLIRRLWKTSTRIGAEAGRLALAHGQPNDVVGAARLAGVLSLIGRALFIRHAPDRCRALLDEAEQTDRPLHELEAEAFTARHEAIGAYALGLWAFSPEVVEAVLDQCDPARNESAAASHPAPWVHAARGLAADPPLVERIPPDETWLAERGVGVTDENAGRHAA